MLGERLPRVIEKHPDCRTQGLTIDYLFRTMSGVSAPHACPALFHVGVSVSDMERALAFYADGLGLQVASDRVAASETLEALTGGPVASMRIVLLEAPGGGVVELLQYDPGVTPDPEPRPPAPTSRPGTGHLCLFVDNLDATTSRLLERGGTQVSRAAVRVSAGEYQGSSCVYLRDPDGFLVELFSRTPAEVPVS
jgi:catechol 2,3-dioxygenase-like lactoylglutathione lyase family enzyme